MRPLPALCRALLLALPVVAARGSGSAFLAKNPGVQPVALQRKIPGACAVDVSAIYDDKVCATPRVLSGCVSNLRTALGELLTEVGSKSCVGGDPAAAWVLKLEVPTFTVQYVEVPPSSLATTFDKDAQPTNVAEYTLHIHFAVRDPKGREVLSIDRDLTERQEPLGSFDDVGQHLLDALSRTLTETIKTQAVAGWE